MSGGLKDEGVLVQLTCQSCDDQDEVEPEMGDTIDSIVDRAGWSWSDDTPAKLLCESCTP